MFTKISRLSISIFIISMMFASCSVIQQKEFAQRKYYNFPRTNHDVVQLQSTENSIATRDNHPVGADKNIHQENILSDKTIKREPVIVASVNKEQVSSPIESKNVSPLKSEASQIKVQAENKTSAKHFNKSDILNHAVKKVYSPFKKGDPEVMLLLMVIASLVVPFIAVYIKDKWKTLKWFWVTLIIWLLAVGTLGVGTIFFAGGGLWFAAAVIALLHVFDVI